MRPFQTLVVSAALLFGAAAFAKPPSPAAFCQKYGSAPVCTGGQPACTYCHTSPPTRNAYGAQVESTLLPGAARPLSDDDFTANLAAALTAAESADSDGDGVSNLIEIQKGSLPGDAHSFPNDVPCAGGPNPGYSVCKYDTKYVYRKLVLDFCGTSPTYEQLKAFVALPDAMKPAQLDATLDGCLQTEFWRGKNGQLWQLANRKIRPVGSLKQGEDHGLIQLADYYDDYNLFTYTQIDGHDARDVLVAKYFATRKVDNGKTTYDTATSLQVQGVDTVHRAGELTTAWNLVYNVMFTALPRNAASQAYRGYLGLDIAKQEGLYPIANEPRDYDNKGVTQSLCTQCHATLDPLSYPFRNYNGLTDPKQGQYVPRRLETMFASPAAPNIGQTPENGFIFGQPVANLTEWASVAANSDQFAVATVNDYWRLINGAPPTPEQNAEFTTVWKSFKTTHAYSVDKMLHDLIHTEAYGAP